MIVQCSAAEFIIKSVLQPLLSRLKAGFQSVPMRVDFLMLVSQSVSHHHTPSEKAGDLEVLDCFQQLKLL